MASFSETLTAKHGGVPTWGWFAIAVGALVVVMFLRNRNASSTAAQSDTGQSTDLGSAANAQALTQGAYPMAYMGGDIYNNVLSQPSATATVTPGPAPAPGPDPNVYNIPYKVKSGDTWASIGKQYGISAQHVFSVQNTTAQKPGINGKPAVGTVLLIPYNVRLGAGSLPPGAFKPTS